MTMILPPVIKAQDIFYEEIISNRIPVHKFMLSLRSPVFKAMLASDMSETITNESMLII